MNDHPSSSRQAATVVSFTMLMLAAQAAAPHILVDGMQLWAPAAAIALASLVVVGARWAPLLAVGAVVGSLTASGLAELTRTATPAVVAIAVVTAAGVVARHRLPTATILPRLAVVGGGTTIVAGALWATADVVLGSSQTWLALATDHGIATGAAMALFTPVLISLGTDRRQSTGVNDLLVPATSVIAAAGVLAGAGVLPPVVFIGSAVAPALAFWASGRQTTQLLALTGLLSSAAALPALGAVTGRFIPIILIHVAIVCGGVHVASRRQHLAQLRAEASEATYETVVDALAEGVIVLDGHGATVRINPAACSLFGVTEPDVLGEAPGYGTVQFVDRNQRALAAADLPSARAQQGEEVDNVVIGLVFPDGSRAWTSMSSRLLPAADDPTSPVLVLSVSDITARIEADMASRAETAQLRHRALHDSLTGLPNRTLLMDRLSHSKQNATRRGTATGLIVIDLDGFKAVNDTLGHAAGDEVLVQVAVRLRTTLRASDTAARLGGDEFVVLCEDLHPAMADLELTRIADRIQSLLNEPYITTLGPADVGASLGSSIALPGQPLDLELVVAADEAMMVDKRERKQYVRPAERVDADQPDVQPDVAKLSVFIVDDDPAMRLLASRILETSGTPLHVVGEAAEGASAITSIIANGPDLVLCDVMMPSVSGPEVVSAVRKVLPGQRFIFWSATTAPELERYEEELGVPFVLKDRIEELPAALLDISRRATSAV